MATLALISFILQLVSGYYNSIGIIAAVLVPMCGYFGVRRRSRTMVSCFTACNIVLAVLFIISFVLSAAFAGGDYVTCACDETCRSDHEIPASTARDICSNRGRYRALYWASMGFAFAMAALQCLGCIYGSRLLKTAWFAPHPVLPSALPVGTVSYPSQPAGPYPPAYPHATVPTAGYATGGGYGGAGTYVPGRHGA